MLLHCGGARRIFTAPAPQITIAAAADQRKNQQRLAHISACAPLYHFTRHYKPIQFTCGSFNTIRYYIYNKQYSISATRSSERERPSPIHMSGRGRGNRGEYYKNKYGRGNAGRFGGGRQGHQSPDDDGSSPSYRADQLRSHGRAEDLRDSLRRLEGSLLHALQVELLYCEKEGNDPSGLACVAGQSYPRYHDIEGSWHFEGFTFILDRAQSDPFAQPSRCRVQVRGLG